MSDSNRPPLHCQRSALPDELMPRRPGGTRTHGLLRVMQTILPLIYWTLAGLSRQSSLSRTELSFQTLIERLSPLFLYFPFFRALR